MTKTRQALAWVGDEGYERMEFARINGWHPVPAWGRDGWDLGDWPLVCVYHRVREHRTCEQVAGQLVEHVTWEYDLAVDVEGDVMMEGFESEAERNRATDEIALFHWRRQDREWVRGVASVDAMPEQLRGPFSWARAGNERSAA